MQKKVSYELWYHDVLDQGPEDPQQYPNNQQHDEERLRPQNHGTDDFDSEENRNDDAQPRSEENDSLGGEGSEDVDDDQQEKDDDSPDSEQYGNIDDNQPDTRNNSESDHNSTEPTDPAEAARAREGLDSNAPPVPPRSAPAIPVPPRPSRDIPGRLLTRGDLIRYFTGYINTETEEEIWSTAVVIHMEMSLQRRYPNHYNVASEDGSNCCLELLPGMKWEVRRNNTWESY